VPPLFRSISMEFEGQLGFGMATSADKQLMTQFNVQKVPTLLIMFPAEEKAEGGQVQMQGMAFEPKMHGKFNFGNIANFVASFVQQKLGVAAAQKAQEERANKPSQAAPKKELGPLPELSKENFDDECVKVGGLCAIALLDGGPDNVNKAAHLEMLTALRKRKQGGPLAFSWVDATCHVGFAAHFELSEMDLPALVVLSPSKLKWARNVGAFDGESLGVFASSVASGRQRTDEMKELPPLEDVDCATVQRGAPMEEETPMDEDMLAEILEEERLARLERMGGEEAAAEEVEEVKDTSKMSEVEKLEAELELCEKTDLMCIARNDKLQKTIDKKRELERKLAEIAAKKKKKKKKAKKAAA